MLCPPILASPMTEVSIYQLSKAIIDATQPHLKRSIDQYENSTNAEIKNSVPVYVEKRQKLIREVGHVIKSHLLERE